MTANAQVGAAAEQSSVSRVVTAIDAAAGASLDAASSIEDPNSTVVLNDNTKVELSSEAESGIVIDGLGSADLVIGIPFANITQDVSVEDDVVVYDHGNGSATTPLVLTDEDILQILTTIVDSSAPTAYAYPIDIQPGSSIRLTPDGGATVSTKDGIVYASVAKPWAVDANGNRVKTRFQLSGNTLVQVVDHRRAGIAYPVVADPRISLGWYVYVHFNRAETKTISGGGWGAAGGSAACALAGSAIAGPVGAATMGAGCLAQLGSIVYVAGVAQNSNPKKCLYLKWRPGLPVIPGSYRDSRCK